MIREIFFKVDSIATYTVLTGYHLGLSFFFVSNPFQQEGDSRGWGVLIIALCFLALYFFSIGCAATFCISNKSTGLIFSQIHFYGLIILPALLAYLCFKRPDFPKESEVTLYTLFGIILTGMYFYCIQSLLHLNQRWFLCVIILIFSFFIYYEVLLQSNISAHLPVRPEFKYSEEYPISSRRHAFPDFDLWILDLDKKKQKIEVMPRKTQMSLLSNNSPAKDTYEAARKYFRGTRGGFIESERGFDIENKAYLVRPSLDFTKFAIIPVQAESLENDGLHKKASYGVRYSSESLEKPNETLTRGFFLLPDFGLFFIKDKDKEGNLFLSSLRIYSVSGQYESMELPSLSLQNNRSSNNTFQFRNGKYEILLFGETKNTMWYFVVSKIQ